MFIRMLYGLMSAVWSVRHSLQPDVTFDKSDFQLLLPLILLLQLLLLQLLLLQLLLLLLLLLMLLR